MYTYRHSWIEVRSREEKRDSDTRGIKSVRGREVPCLTFIGQDISICRNEKGRVVSRMVAHLV